LLKNITWQYLRRGILPKMALLQGQKRTATLSMSLSEEKEAKSRITHYLPLFNYKKKIEIFNNQKISDKINNNF